MPAWMPLTLSPRTAAPSALPWLHTFPTPCCQVFLTPKFLGVVMEYGGMDLGALQKFMEQLEGEWTSLVNETLTMDSKRFENEPG